VKLNITMLYIYLFLFILLSSCGMEKSDDASIVVNSDKCIGASCRICEKVCPFDAIHFYGPDNTPVIDPDKCTQCGDCVRECPEQAITGRGQ